MQVKRFLPFLAGNRSCIGMKLAKLNYTTAVASLLSRFSFRLSEDVSTLCMPPVHSKHASSSQQLHTVSSQLLMCCKKLCMSTDCQHFELSHLHGNP